METTVDEPIDVKYGFNPLDQYDTPTDALGHVACLVRFINEIMGANRDELILTDFGREGFQFLLNFVEGSLRQVNEAITKEKGKKISIQEAAKGIGKYIIENHPNHKDLKESLQHLTDAIEGKGEKKVLTKKNEDSFKAKEGIGKSKTVKGKKKV